MRVAHFSDTYLPRRDGVVTSIRTLAEALGDRGHQSVLFAPRAAGRLSDPALPVVGLPSLPCGVANLRLAAWPRTRHVAAVAAAGPDVVHVHTPGPAGLLGILAAARLGIPLVQTYHTDLHAYLDAYRIPTRAVRMGLAAYRRRLGSPGRGPRRLRTVPVRPAESRRTSRRRELLDDANRLLLHGTDILVVPTAVIRDRIVLPMDEARIVVVPTGVAARPVSPTAGREFRARYGIGAGERVVLFVGRVNREKNVDLLLAAFERVRAARPDARLVLVGAVYEAGWLDGRLARHGVAAHTVCTGQLGGGEVAEAYAAADVFAFPSRSETQGLVLQEAALAAVPVVTVDEALQAHGVLAGAALWTPATPEAFAAGLVRVLDEPATAARVATDCHAAAVRHTPQEYAAAMEAVYRTAMYGLSTHLAEAA